MTALTKEQIGENTPDCGTFRLCRVSSISSGRQHLQGASCGEEAVGSALTSFTSSFTKKCISDAVGT
jgi:hypothetical protein